MIPAGVGLTNTLLPLLGLTGLALVLPVVTLPRGVTSQRRLALGMGAAGAMVLATAIAGFALFHAAVGDAIRPGAALRPALMSALVWGPVWALVWLLRAQGVEARKGRAAMRAGLDLGGGA